MDLTVYTAPWCGDCRVAKAWLKKHNIAFHEINIDKIDRIMLSGGASRAEGFTEMLTERFEAPVEPFDPFRKVAFDAKRFKTDPADIAPTVAVAVGLGLRRVGDR